MIGCLSFLVSQAALKPAEQMGVAVLGSAVYSTPRLAGGKDVILQPVQICWGPHSVIMVS